MITPLSAATGGYLTGVARDIVSIMADGYLVSVVAKRRGGGRRITEGEHPYRTFLRREDDDLLLILAAWIMEVGNANTR